MAACQYRPDDGSMWTPCVRYEGGEKHVCRCGDEVREALEVQAVGTVRVPDSAREVGA